jgi:hypothetical protein
MKKKDDDSLRIDCRMYSSILDIDCKEWDSILDDEHILNSYSYQKVIELSNINNFHYHYLMFFHEGRLIAHVSVAVTHFELDMMAGGIYKKIASFVRKAFPNFFRITMIECGHPTALGPSIEIADNAYISGILDALDSKLKLIAIKEKTPLIIIRDFYPNHRKDYDILKQQGYGIFQNLPNTFIRNEFEKFDEYLDDLTSKRRYEIIHNMEAFAAQNCTVEKIEDFAGLADELNGLWRMTYDHAKEYQREILNTDYFRLMSELMKNRSFILLCRKGKRPIGFTMFLDSGSSLVSTYCGLDYTENKTCFTYFILFYKSIEELISTGKKNLELGITNYNPKIEVGAVPEPAYVYFKSLNPVINILFIPLMLLMNTSPDFNKRKIFNSRYYTRFHITDHLESEVNGIKVKITDLSINGFGCESPVRFKKNRVYDMKIQIEDDFDILIKVKAKNIAQLASSVFRTGFMIHKLEKEYLVHWYYLVDHYENEQTVKYEKY